MEPYESFVDESSGFTIGDVNEYKSKHPELTTHRSNEEPLTGGSKESQTLESMLEWAKENKGKALLISLAGIYGLRKFNLLGKAVMMGGAAMTKYLIGSSSQKAS